jgi:hypothetical protein
LSHGKRRPKVARSESSDPPAQIGLGRTFAGQVEGDGEVESASAKLVRRDRQPIRISPQEKVSRGEGASGVTSWTSSLGHRARPSWQRQATTLGHPHATDAISADEPLLALAVTTTFPDPPPDDCVPLPWHPQGRVLTGLRKRSAAVLSWIVSLDIADVLMLHGDVPAPLMHEILRRLDARADA